MLMLFILIFFVATGAIFDIRTGHIPIYIAIAAYFIRFTELFICEKDKLLYYAVLSLIILFLMMIMAYIGNLGGADCLFGAVCGIYLGVGGVFSLMLAFLFSIPQAFFMKIRKNEHDYPFLPYILAGIVITILITFSKGEM